MVYPPEILRLLEIDGFNKAFEEKMAEHKTYSEAYEEVERLHYAKFGKRKYSDYESFRVFRTRLIKKSKK